MAVAGGGWRTLSCGSTCLPPNPPLAAPRPLTRAGDTPPHPPTALPAEYCTDAVAWARGP